MNRITQKLPLITLHKETIEIPENISLADPKFCKPKDIDILIGVDLFWKTLKSGQIHIKQLTLFESVFGWLISGYTTNKSRDTRICNHSTVNFDLEKFWKIENFQTEKRIQTNQ